MGNADQIGKCLTYLLLHLRFLCPWVHLSPFEERREGYSSSMSAALPLRLKFLIVVFKLTVLPIMPASSREKAPGKIGWRCIDKIQEYSNLYYMKATLEIPDELYRNVKARSALEGRPIRAIAVELFEK